MTRLDTSAGSMSNFFSSITAASGMKPFDRFNAVRKGRWRHQRGSSSQLMSPNARTVGWVARLQWLHCQCLITGYNLEVVEWSTGRVRRWHGVDHRLR